MARAFTFPATMGFNRAATTRLCAVSGIDSKTGTARLWVDLADGLRRAAAWELIAWGLGGWCIHLVKVERAGRALFISVKPLSKCYSFAPFVDCAVRAALIALSQALVHVSPSSR